MAEFSLASVPGAVDDIGWEAVAVVCIHSPILAISAI
jgi:hypothetical protein